MCVCVFVCDSIIVNVLIWLSHFVSEFICRIDGCVLFQRIRFEIQNWVVFIQNGIIDFKFIFITFKIQPLLCCFLSANSFFVCLALLELIRFFYNRRQKSFTIKNQIENPKIKHTHTHAHDNNKCGIGFLVYHVFSLSIQFWCCCRWFHSLRCSSETVSIKVQNECMRVTWRRRQWKKATIPTFVMLIK